MRGLDISELADVMPVEPGEEGADGPIIGYAGVAVADRRGEEFKIISAVQGDCTVQADAGQ
jgi:hypothetical protein